MAKKRTVKKKAIKEETAEPMYIGLSEPAELRKHILEPTREVIQFLQSYEQFKKTKREKTEVMLQLKEGLKEIKTEINRLRRLLPKSKAKGKQAYKKIEEKIKKEWKIEKQEAKPKPVVRIPTELESLEKELGEIEKKLGTISE